MYPIKVNVTVVADVSNIAQSTLIKLLMIKLEEKDIKMLRGISTGAGIFTLIVALTMLFSLLQLKAMDPLDNPAITSIKDQYDKDPENAVKAEQVRALDLMARKAYFSSRRQVETGSYLLIAGAVIFILCQRLIAGSEKIVPSIPGEHQDQVTGKSRYIKYLTGSAAFLVVAAIISSFMLRSNLPDLSGKRVTKLEKSAEKKAERKVIAETYKPDETNWPFFRGQNGRAIAGGSGYPADWNGEEGKNIKWKIQIPKDGKSSPVIWGNKLFLTGAEGTSCEVYCINKETGKMEWQASASGLPGEPSVLPEISSDASIAASSAATDGKSVFAIFANGNLICLDMNGGKKWAKNIGAPNNVYGYSCSLVIHEGLLIVQFDSNEKVSLMGFDTGTGDLKYETLRRGRPTWSSPVIAKFNGEPQVLINGNPEVTAFNPKTGAELWSIEVLTGDVAPSLAVNSSMVYAVTDYARLAAIKPGPGPSIVWEDNTFTPDVSSPAATDNFLFIATGTGDAACYNAQEGDTLWSHYFPDQFYASPVVADEKVYFLDRSGVMHIVKAGPQFELVAECPLGEPADCTPAFSDKNIYVRGRYNLFCISEN
jgi:outer membrane protein assembly factor BamB